MARNGIEMPHGCILRGAFSRAKHTLRVASQLLGGAVEVNSTNGSLPHFAYGRDLA